MGYTLLCACDCYSYDSIIFQRRCEIVRSLLEHGANMIHFYAIHRGNIGTVRILLQNGSNIRLQVWKQSAFVC
jgi:ankyrin repeat protein